MYVSAWSALLEVTPVLGHTSFELVGHSAVQDSRLISKVASTKTDVAYIYQL